MKIQYDAFNTLQMKMLLLSVLPNKTIIDGYGIAYVYLWNKLWLGYIYCE